VCVFSVDVMYTYSLNHIFLYVKTWAFLCSIVAAYLMVRVVSVKVENVPYNARFPLQKNRT